MCAGLLLAPLLLLGATRTFAQPDWVPPEVADRRRRAAEAEVATEAADPCADPQLAVLAPPMRDTGFDRTRSPCLASSFAVRTGAVLIRGGPELRDTAAASATLDLRWLCLADLELTFGVRVVEGRFAAGEDVVGDEEEEDASFGPAYLAAAAGNRTRAFGRPLRLVWALRLDLPWTDSARADTPTVAVSPQVVAALELGRRLSAQGRAAALLWLALPSDDVDTRRALAISADATWAPWRNLAGGIGLEAQSGWHGSGLDHLLARGGLRVALGSRARLELAGAAPLVGREPTDLLLELGLLIGPWKESGR